MRRPDITIARTVLGWEPEIALEAGLQKTIPYFRKLVEEKGAGARPLETTAQRD